MRHAAQAVVSELSNLVGGPAVLLGADQPAAPALREAMATRRAAIAALPAGSVDREEAADEARFWEVLDAGGQFLRDGETTEAHAQAGGAGPVGGLGQEVPEGEEEQEQEGQEGQQAPVLLLEPPKLAGASQAP